MKPDLHLMSQGMERGDDERELRGEGCLGWVKEDGRRWAYTEVGLQETQVGMKY